MSSRNVDTPGSQTPTPDQMHLRFYPDPVLRKRAEDIPTVDEAVRVAARRMFDIMYEAQGIGLAGPQVGWSGRIFVVNLSGERDEPDAELVFINPELSDFEGESVVEEGCLSFPDLRVDVTRPEQVRIRARGLDGEMFEIAADKLMARCVQHENDHLDGILFVTRIPITARMTIRKALKQLEREYKEEGER